MGYRGYRVVAVTPAGRRQYLELLVPQVVALAPVLDAYELWLNTTVPEDVAYIEALAELHDLVSVARLPPGVEVEGSFSICRFFRGCTDPDTIYVRFDDDIVVVDDAEHLTRFLDYRIDHPEYFLVYANVLNNAIMSHIHQRHGTLDIAEGIADYLCWGPDSHGWRSGPFAEHLHEQVLARLRADGDLSRYRLPLNWLLYYNERVSINCISWLGKTFQAFDGHVGRDEEQWLSSDKPAADGSMNSIFGDFCVVHYAFYSQREHLDRAGMLHKYAAVVRVLRGA